MSDAVGPSHHLPPPQSTPATANVPALVKQMQEQVLAIAENLQKILEDPSITEQPSFLQKMTDDGSRLNTTVEQAIKLR